MAPIRECLACPECHLLFGHSNNCPQPDLTGTGALNALTDLIAENRKLRRHIEQLRARNVVAE